MNRVIAAVSILAIALGLRLGYESVYRSGAAAVPPAKPLSEFPFGLAGKEWNEVDLPLEAEIQDKAGVSEYVSRAFRRSGVDVWFYVGYYDGVRVEGMHQPEICFPGAGWEKSDVSAVAIELPGEASSHFNEVLFTRGASKKYTLYTFYYDSEFNPKQGAVERGRILGARNFAVITMAAETGGEFEEAKRLLQGLARRLLPRVVAHLRTAQEAREGQGETEIGQARKLQSQEAGTQEAGTPEAGTPEAGIPGIRPEKGRG